MVPVIGYGIVGFGFIIGGDIALSYCTDCYQDVSAALISANQQSNLDTCDVDFRLSPMPWWGLSWYAIRSQSLSCSVLHPGSTPWELKTYILSPRVFPLLSCCSQSPFCSGVRRPEPGQRSATEKWHLNSLRREHSRWKPSVW